MKTKGFRKGHKPEDIEAREDSDFLREVAPDLKKQLRSAPKVDKGYWGDFLPDGLSDTEIHLVDMDGSHLDFRVGPVYGARGIAKRPGLWVSYQRRHMASTRSGELLISSEIWRRLSQEIGRRFRAYKSSDYGRLK